MVKLAFKVGDTENCYIIQSRAKLLKSFLQANAGYELDSVSYKLTSAEDVVDSYTTVTAT